MGKKYLYHYTTIDTLALILKNRTMRFNSLSNVDDLEECKAKDLESIGKYCFVSCWSATEKENLALWQMYSKNGTGVRIRLPINPFEKYINSEKEIRLYGDGRTEIAETGNKYESIFEGDSLRCGYYLQDPKEDEFLLPVKYTDDETKIYPNVLKGNSIDMIKVGSYKNTHWLFQEEWRYRFLVYPLSIEESKEYINDPTIAIDKVKNQVELPITSFDLKIDSESFSDMEIELGPNTTISDEIIVKALIDSFNSTANMIHSQLKDRVRIK